MSRVIFERRTWPFLREKVIEWHHNQWYNEWRWSSRIWCTSAVLVFLLLSFLSFFFLLFFLMCINSFRATKSWFRNRKGKSIICTIYNSLYVPALGYIFTRIKIKRKKNITKKQQSKVKLRPRYTGLKSMKLRLQRILNSIPCHFFEFPILAMIKICL